MTAQAMKLAQNLQEIGKMLELEAEKARSGQPSIARGGQLEVIIKQVATMTEQLQSRQLPPVERRVRGMAKIVIDSWPMDSDLGLRIVTAEQAYLKLKG